MTEDKVYTLDEAQLLFAKRTNGRTWELLEKPDRIPLEDEEMLCAAYASLFHWLYAGNELHRQRGEWLISRVYAVLGNAAEALHHAERCLQLTQGHPELMQDFDLAFAQEGIARAKAAAGDQEQALRYLAIAQSLGKAIKNTEDHQIFFETLRAGPWFEVKLP